MESLAHAVIFDLDGVLIRSESVHAAAYRELFDAEGMSFTLQDFRALGRGVPRREVILRVLGRDVAEARLECLMRRKGELVVELLERGGLEPVAGARELVRDLREAGVPRGVASVSTMPHEFLRSVELLDDFDAVLGGDSVTVAKPAPDVYLECARLLGVAPGRCVAIEDSAPGVASARAAGMRVIGLLTTATADDLEEADLLSADMADVRGQLGLDD